MPKKRLRPWYAGQQWAVETVATNDGRGYKRGDWVQIYNSATKSEALKDAVEWTAKMQQATRVVPGPGHKSRRGF